MKKTTIYLPPEHAGRLKQLAEAEGRSQSEIVRDAILLYASRATLPRTFVMAGIAEGPGGSAADIPEEELLEGFDERHLRAMRPLDGGHVTLLPPDLASNEH